MRRRLVASFLFNAAFLHSCAACAWGPDGHAIVAELAQRRLEPHAAREVARLLGRGASLASISMWADDVRDARPETGNWHFVDIPAGSTRYDAARDCRPTPRGDCIVAALDRVRDALGCANDITARREALRLAVHLVADVHQPFHAIGDERGGNDVRVELAFHPAKCPRCAARHGRENLHATWDSTLIAATAKNWGAYVTRLEERRLPDADTRRGTGSPAQWAEEAHAGARDMRAALAGGVVDDAYYAKALPVLDRQLALAGMRLASFLNTNLARRCPF